MKKWFSNSGVKLKNISKVLFVIGCLISFVVGILIWDDYRLRWLYALIIMIVGPLLTYIQTLLLYTFAQMADDIANARKSVEE